MDPVPGCQLSLDSALVVTDRCGVSEPTDARHVCVSLYMYNLAFKEIYLQNKITCNFQYLIIKVPIHINCVYIGQAQKGKMQKLSIASMKLH